MAEAAVITVRVTPRAARDEVLGFEAGVLRVRLRASPVEGQANAALMRLLAERLGLPQRDIVIAAGGTARTKRLRIFGLSAAALAQRLEGSSTG